MQLYHCCRRSLSLCYINPSLDHRVRCSWKLDDWVPHSRSDARILQQLQRNLVKRENVAIANALQLEAAGRRAVPSRFNSSPVPSLKSLSLSVAVLERIYCWYVTLRCHLELWPRDLDLWPLTLNICSRPASPRSNSVPNLSEIEQFAAELLQFEYLTLWPWTCMTCCAMLWDSLHKSLNSVKLSVHEMCRFFDANTSYHAMPLTFDPLTLKVCGRCGGTWS